MQIIFDQDVAETLKNSHTVLPLETFVVNGKPQTAHCVVPADKIPLTDFPQLSNQVDLHKAFVNAYNTKDYKLCEDLYEHLMGKFSGELDSFYEEILNRIKK